MLKQLQYILLLVLAGIGILFGEGKPFSVRFGSICLWGPDFYAVNNQSLAVSPDTVRLLSSGTYESLSVTSAPLIGIHMLAQIPIGERFIFEVGPVGQWKETRLTLLRATPTSEGYDRTMIKYNYWGAGTELGLYYRRPVNMLSIHYGGFLYSGFTGWGSNVDDYTEKGKACDDNGGFFGIGGCAPLGLNGDKKSNNANGFEFGGGIRVGGEYHITERLSFALEGSVRYTRSFVNFNADYHVWEDTEPYKDLHTEWFLNKAIPDDAAFSVSPSMFGLSAGLCFELK